MKKLKIYHINAVMAGFLLLQGCSLAKEEITIERKYLNEQDVNKLTNTLENNENLNEDEKSFFTEYLNIVKTFPYVNAENLEQDFSNVDIFYGEMPEENTQKEETQIIAFLENDGTQTIYQLFYMLHGENNGEFMNKAIASFLAREYGHGSTYPFEQAIAGMFTEIYGSDFILESFLTDENLLKDAIAQTADATLADVLFESFEEYEAALKDKNTNERILEKKEEIIVSFVEIIYRCKFNQPVEENENMVAFKKSMKDADAPLKKSYYNRAQAGIKKKLSFPYND